MRSIFARRLVLVAAILLIALLMNRVQHINSSSQIHRPPPIELREDSITLQAGETFADYQVVRGGSDGLPRLEKKFEANSEEPNVLFGKPILETIHSQCVNVINGGLIQCPGGENEAIFFRVESVICPQQGESMNEEAKQFTTDFCQGRQVKLMKTGEERSNRISAWVLVGNQNLSIELLRAGLAKLDGRYSENVELAAIEEQAKNQTVGIWQPDRLESNR